MKIEIQNLGKQYGNQDILKNLNFSVDHISSLGMIGSSGCGKSTLLRQLAGIEGADQGSITIDGLSPVTDKNVFQEKIAVVFQRHHLFPHLSIEENITLILRKIKKQDKETAQKKALELLTQLRIVEQRHKRPSEISGGQAQRASIARALATDPDLIFLDEPTAALDPQLTYEVLQAVDQLKSTGKQFVFVTHEMKFLRRFADYFIYLNEGEIIEHGAVAQLDQPQSKQLTDFLAPYRD